MRQNFVITYWLYQLLQINLIVDWCFKYFFILIFFYNTIICVFWVFEKFLIEYFTSSHFLFYQFFLFNATNLRINFFSTFSYLSLFLSLSFLGFVDI